MSRVLSEDFEKLLLFIKSYSLKIDDKDTKEKVSQMHKKYFSYIALIYELKDAKVKGIPILNTTQKEYFIESLSDIANCFFLTINGAYKPAKLILRSSIETFIKGFSHDEVPNIIIEKNVYRVFESTKNLSFFNKQVPIENFDKLSQNYSELSKDTHTAHKSNMQHTASLAYFPKNSKDELNRIAHQYSSIISAFVVILVLKFNDSFHKIHHKNKNIILNAVPKKIRPIIMNVE